VDRTNRLELAGVSKAGAARWGRPVPSLVPKAMT
jgi:hypothetical protein